MSSLLRGAVSKKKRRFQKDGFDLDLTYVTPRIIAMGFPSEKVEAAFRNPMKEVLRFLDSYHKDHYKVYNLCSERNYDPEKFYKRVEVFPFEDHNAPPFEMILHFCQNVSEWLALDTKNIAVIHCKAGKGRTGLMICAFLLYSKQWTTAKDALSFYAAMRTYNQKGVTIPSQIRYVNYFAESMVTPPQPKTLLLNKIVFHTIPKKTTIADIKFTVHVGKTLVFAFKDKSGVREENSLVFECGNVPLSGDVRVEFTNDGNKMLAFWFSTSFVKNNRLVLSKEELDKANKDTKHKAYDQDFCVELVFTDITLASEGGQAQPNNEDEVAVAAAASANEDGESSDSESGSSESDQ